MKNKTQHPPTKRRKWLISIIAVIVVLALLFPFALEYYLEKKLPSLVSSKTPYTVKLADFKLNLFKGNISVLKVDIATKNPADKTITQIKGHAEKVEITNMGLFAAAFKKSYNADKIVLNNSDITVKLAAPKKKEAKERKPFDLNVNSLEVKNVTANISDALGKPVFTGKNIHINIKDIKQSESTSKIPLAFSKINIDASNVKIGVNEFYEIDADKINTDNRILTLTKFRLKPLQDPSKYNAKNVFDFAADEFVAKNFAVSQDSLIVNEVLFLKPDLKVMSTGKNNVEKNTNPKEVEMKIGMKNIHFKNGKIAVFQANKEKTASVDNFNFNLSDIVFDKNTVKEKIPFRFTNHDMEAENIYFKTNPLQAIKVSKITSKNSDIILDDFKMIALGKSNVKDVFSVSTKQLKILKNKSKFNGQKLNLNFAGIEVNQPVIEVYSAAKKAQTKKKDNAVPEFLAQIGYINIINGKIKHSLNSKEKLSVGEFNVKLNNVKADPETLKATLPFTAVSHLVNLKKLHLDAGKYYSLNVAEIVNSGKKTDITNIQYLPKYSRKAFSRVIEKEADLYTLKAKRISILDHNTSFGKNGAVDIEKVFIDGLNCNIYHDLAPPDDVAVRYLFSKKLRDMKMPLFVKNVVLKNSELVYEEDADNKNIPGKIIFSNFNANIANVNNGKIKGRPTVISTDAQFDFYDNAHTDVNWKFDVLDKADKYTIKGDIQKLSAENVNLFVRPYLNVTLDGQIDYLKFDYYGDSKGIAGRFYFKYKDMYVNLLNKQGKERKLLSTVANWFVKNESTGEPDHVVIEKEREPTRSFFSMLWQGIMEGLKKYVI
ncbi:hypothetical protein ASG31_05360 [Chryseobacterium sp. Leaf404]|uniref:hypothetical protein n=1 Tax=unclassified Chryseobacterium TaxID=2593645 RepID=UPI0006F32132|nr:MULTISPECIES: hypothetical protein [unclassified Chryseobacterium]KQT18162.1 hypothetical protein ASG31_05360 [Chryseobacterium sp. Leaf404]